MTHGLPRDLSALYSLVRMHRKIGEKIDKALPALTAKHDPEVLAQILNSTEYPLPIADPDWLRGWRDAADGSPVKSSEHQAYRDGYQEYLRNAT